MSLPEAERRQLADCNPALIANSTVHTSDRAILSPDIGKLASRLQELTILDNAKQEAYAAIPIKRIRLRKLRYLMALGLCLFSFFAYSSGGYPLWAQDQSIQSIGFRLGDDVTTVKRALKTEESPKPFHSVFEAFPSLHEDDSGKSILEDNTIGASVLFDKTGKAENIRLMFPFRGNVLGVKIGESTSNVLTKLGQPSGTVDDAAGVLSYNYKIGQGYYIHYFVGGGYIRIITISH